MPDRATSYRCTFTVRCWKKYDCLGCGAVFRHRFKREGHARGPTPGTAESNARDAALAALRGQVDVVPCPECGRVQPRMVGHQKNVAHFRVNTAFFIAGCVPLLIGATDVMNRDLAALAVAFFAALALLVHVAIALRNPNRDPKANRRAVARKTRRGTVQVIRPGDPDEGEPPPPLTTTGHVVAFALAGFAALMPLVPVVVRNLNGWTLSKSDPPVLGPGDTFRVTFPDRINCINNTWNGAPEVALEGLSVPGATVTSRNDSWGTTMSWKSRDASTSPTLWAEVTLPPNRDLQDREVTGTITMTVKYPQATGFSKFDNRQERVVTKFAVKLSKVYAWQSFRVLWWGGLCSGIVLAVLGGWCLAWLAGQMKRNSPPDLIESLDTPPGDRPPPKRARNRE